MQDELAGELLRRRQVLHERVADGKAAAEIEDARRPFELVTTVLGHVDEALNGEQALGGAHEL